MKNKEIIIAPSLLAADFSNLEKELDLLSKTKAKYLHLDIMDGKFVPNYSFGFPILESIRRKTDLTFDTHLMIENPDLYIERFASIGSDIITVHAESTNHLNRTIQIIKSFNKKVGVALNPSTSLDCIKYDLDNINMVLIMTVNPGFGGQKFIPSMINKITELRTLAPHIDIQVDGGIDNIIAKDVIKAGANILVAGSYIFNSSNYEEKVNSLFQI